MRIPEIRAIPDSMTTFQKFGLSETLVHMAEEEGIVRPSALQEAAVPIVRRGGNMVAVAASGSGKTLAYGLPVLDRLTEGEGAVRALILLPTGEEASRVARALAPYAAAADLALTVPGDGWRTPASEADVVVTSPAAALQAVQASALKLDAVETLVIDGADLIAELDGIEGLEAIFEHLPRDAQRLFLASALPAGEVAELAERRVKRAMRYPPSPAVAEREPAAEGSVAYVLASEPEMVDVVTRLIEAGSGGAPHIFFRSSDHAAEVADEVTRRGFLLGGRDDEDADLVLREDEPAVENGGEEGDGAAARTISVHVPLDEDILLARHGGSGEATVVLTPRELPHLQEIARRARRTLRSIPVAVETGASAEIEAFRSRIARAVAEEDLAAQLLVIGPLLDRFGTAEVAAAASALLRRKQPEPVAQPRAPVRQDSPAGAVRRAEPTGAGAARAPSTWTRLFISIGDKDGIRAGDLVGAIAGEAEIPGTSIGKINIRESFSVVEVETPVAEKVIRSLNGTTVRGRSVRVDYDRGGPDRKQRPQRESGVRRRPAPRPPREG